jgi:hypothetical protein
MSNDDDVELWDNCDTDWLKALGFTGRLGNTCGWTLQRKTHSGTVLVTWNDHSLTRRPLIGWPVPIEGGLKTRGEFRAALATLGSAPTPG